MPDVDRDASQRLTLEVRHAALHEHPLARLIGRDIGAVRHLLVFADIERTKHGGLGRAVTLAMVHRIDQHRNPEHVRQQDELLPCVGACLADAGQEIDGVAPLVEGEVGLAHIVVQRLHELFHQEFDTLVRRLLETADNGGGKFGIVELGHMAVLRVTRSRPPPYTSDPAGVSVPPLEHGPVFGYQRTRKKVRRWFRCWPRPPLLPNPQECPRRRWTVSNDISRAAISTPAASRERSFWSTAAGKWSTAPCRALPMSSARHRSRTTPSSASIR